MGVKAVLFGCEGVLATGDAQAAPLSPTATAELRHLFEFLRGRGIKPIVLSNRAWHFNLPGGGTQELRAGLAERYGELTVYVAMEGEIPFKPRKECIAAVLEREHLAPHETVLVGMSDADFRTAVNSNLLFLNATWFRKEVDHGFVFDSPTEVQRFIDIFALRDHYWFYEIDEPIFYRSVGPYSTYLESSREYSEAAAPAAKSGTADRHFFINAVVSSLYFTGVIQGVDYIAAVPGHQAGYGNGAMDDQLTVIGNIFRTRYLKDLIVRHTAAPSSRAIRRSNGQPLAVTQLNTTKLTRRPLKHGNERYKAQLSLRGKSVLVFDDFTTNGYSFEACRLRLEAAGARVVLVSWLKTINRGYRVVHCSTEIRPYDNHVIDAAQLSERELSYSAHVKDSGATAELTRAFRRFRSGPD